MLGLAAGMTAMADGDAAGAEAAFASGLRAAAGAPGLADLFGGPLAEATLALGRTDAARELADAGLARLDGDLPWQEAWLRQAQARIALADGMPVRAADQAHLALTLRQAVGDVGGIADTLEFLCRPTYGMRTPSSAWPAAWPWPGKRPAIGLRRQDDRGALDPPTAADWR